MALFTVTEILTYTLPAVLRPGIERKLLAFIRTGVISIIISRPVRLLLTPGRLRIFFSWLSRAWVEEGVVLVVYGVASQNRYELFDVFLQRFVSKQTPHHLILQNLWL